jgi:iron complex outermembrane recepter protein
MAVKHVLSILPQPLLSSTLVIAGLIIATMTQSALAAASSTLPIDLKSQQAHKSLMMLAGEAGVQLMMNSDTVADITLPALKGEYTLDQALEILLAHTGLIYEFTTDDAVVIRKPHNTDSDQLRSVPATEIEEVIVKVGFRGSLNHARYIKRAAPSIVDVITMIDIGKFPDTNVAESLQRISGVTITRYRGQGQQVTVRGMGPEYNMVSFNGRIMASDNRGREFNFDLIASELISGAQVIKSPTASLQDGSIGAVVNIESARPLTLNEFILIGSAKSKYNDLSNDTSPKISGLVSQTFFNGTFGALASFAYSKEFHRSDSLSMGWKNVDTTGNGVKDAWAANGLGFAVVAGDRERLGSTFSLEYKPSSAWHVVLDGLYSSYGADEYRDTFNIALDHSPPNITSNISDQQPVVNHNANVVSRISPNNRVEIAREYWPRYTDNLLVGLNIAYKPSEQFTLVTDMSYSESDQDGRGDGSFYATAGYVDPQINYHGSDATPMLELTHDTYDSSLYRAEFAKSYADKILDRLYDFKIDGLWRSGLGILASVQSGFAINRREKALNFYGSENPCAACFDKPDIPDAIVGNTEVSGLLPGEPDVSFERYPTLDTEQLFGFLGQLYPDAYLPIVEYSNESSKVREKTVAGYLQGNLEGVIANKAWSGNVGVRIISTDQESEGVSTEIVDIGLFGDKNVKIQSVPVEVHNHYTEVLPSANFKWELRDDLTLRTAAAKVMTRPTLTKLSTAVFIDARSGESGLNTIERSNPTLTPYLAKQFDTSIEWYPNRDTGFVLAYFYKNIDSFISDFTQEITLEGLDFQETKPINGNSADVEGWEFALTHSLTYLPSPFDGLGVQANYTLSDSEAHFDKSDSTDSFNLQGLSDRSYNFILFYDKGPLQARVAYNYRSEYQNTAIGAFGEPQFTDAIARVDLSASYDVNAHLTLTLEGANLTDERVYTYQRIKSRTTSLEYNGREWVLGLRYSL